MVQHKQAFTLIELLVVVLIIGVLAAVAIPQYRLAVGKSQYATLKNILESMAKAQEIYYLSNGEYARNLEELDIELPGGKLDTSTKKRYVYDWGECWITADETPRIDCVHKLLNMSYRLNLPHSPLSNQRRCYVRGTTDTSDWRNKICALICKIVGNIYKYRVVGGARF